MPKLIGTNRDDFLIGRDGRDWVIRGRAGDDEIYDGGGGDGTGSGTGNDRLYGDLGDDKLYAISGGFDQALGGKGNDEILVLQGVGRGGVGDDSVTAYGLAVGGPGDDLVGGTGQLWGDEGPGVEQRVAGNDHLHVNMELAGLTQATGGLGADLFTMTSGQDGIAARVEIMDFRSGEDHFDASVWRGFYEGENQDQVLFDRLDANNDNVLDLTDVFSGGAVYFNGSDLILAPDFTIATPTFTDAQDRIVFHGVSQLTLADWLFSA